MQQVFVLKTNFFHYNERMVKVPVSFQFNIPVKDDTTKETKVIHGIVSEEKGKGEREKSKEEKRKYLFYCKAGRAITNWEQKIKDQYFGGTNNIFVNFIY